MTTAPERLSAQQVAEAYYVALSGLSRKAADRTQSLWRELDARDLTGSWESLVGPRILETVTAGQAAAAALADPYLSGVVAVDGGDPSIGPRLRPGSFAGYAADGRTLDSLLYLPVITTKEAIGAGLDETEAMMRGLNQLLRIAASEVTTAGRTATGVGIAARRTVQGYIRIAAAPCCARCAILSGKEFGWNAGFQRHPRLPLRLHPHACHAHQAQQLEAGFPGTRRDVPDGRCWRASWLRRRADLLRFPVPCGARSDLHDRRGAGHPRWRQHHVGGEREARHVHLGGLPAAVACDPRGRDTSRLLLSAGEGTGHQPGTGSRLGARFSAPGATSPSGGDLQACRNS